MKMGNDAADDGIGEMFIIIIIIIIFLFSLLSLVFLFWCCSFRLLDDDIRLTSLVGRVPS